MSTSTNSLLCCNAHRIPKSCPSPLLANFLLALSTIQANSAPFTSPLTYPTSATVKTSETVIGLEIITWRGEGIKRDFTYRYFVPVVPTLSSWEFVHSVRDQTGGNEYSQRNEEAYRQMYPEECFQEISHEVVEERWQGVEEWWRRDESLSAEMGERVGWQCRECGWVYFIRALELGGLNVDGDGEEEEGGSFVSAKSKLE